VNFKKLTTLFLLSLLLTGPEGYAQDSHPAQVPLQASVATPAAPPAMDLWSAGWYQGAIGYDHAAEEYKQTNKPMIVYISVGWCPYCRRFEKEVLSSPLVQNVMRDMIKVNINPESGSRENAIAFQYGARGFPSFFLHPPQPAGAVQFSTGVTPERFIEFFRQVFG
jgi:thiol:disulfide interchange protein